MNRTAFAGAAAMLAMLLAAGPSKADDTPLIWQPAKNSDTSYSVKVGVKLPTALQPQAGFDLGVDAAKDGSVVDTPVRFWTNFKAQSIERPAYEMSRDIGVDIDGNVGSAGITMNYLEKEIVTPSIDLERQAIYDLRYDGAAQQWTGLDSSHSLKFVHEKTGTAVFVRANSADNFKVAGGGLGVEQKFGDHITFTSSFDQASASATPVTSVNARYDFKW